MVCNVDELELLAAVVTSMKGKFEEPGTATMSVQHDIGKNNYIPEIESPSPIPLTLTSTTLKAEPPSDTAMFIVSEVLPESFSCFAEAAVNGES